MLTPLAVSQPLRQEIRNPRSKNDRGFLFLLQQYSFSSAVSLGVCGLEKRINLLFSNRTFCPVTFLQQL